MTQRYMAEQDHAEEKQKPPDIERGLLPELPPETIVEDFCQTMKHPQAPRDFTIKIIKKLQKWHLLNSGVIPEQVVDDYEKVKTTMQQAKAKAQERSPQFLAAFSNDPWNYDYGIEGEYSEEELSEKIPRALELKKIINQSLKFIFRAEPASRYLLIVEHHDGRRQVLRITNIDRSIEDINSDIQKAPSIIPKFEAVRFGDGKTGLLIDWVNGKPPITSKEKALCLARSDELLTVPMASYDLWAGNFLISTDVDSTTGQKKFFILTKMPPKLLLKKVTSRLPIKEKNY